MAEPIDIAGAANRSKRTKVEGNNETERHSLPDLIAADRYQQANEQAKKPGGGIGYARFRHQGTR
jgi:hypothetical protein